MSTQSIKFDFEDLPVWQFAMEISCTLANGLTNQFKQMPDFIQERLLNTSINIAVDISQDKLGIAMWSLYETVNIIKFVDMQGYLEKNLCNNLLEKYKKLEQDIINLINENAKTGCSIR